MSIQDDIFDVEAALEGKPEAQTFENLVTYLGNLERAIEIHSEEISMLEKTVESLSRLFRKKSPGRFEKTSYVSVLKTSEGIKFLTPRRSTGRQYESRSGWSLKFEDAKVFNTASAAKNSASASGEKDAKVVPIVTILDM